ncbi:MAG: O-antigen ligase family protein [Actinomycetota bacterium]
MTVLYPLQGLTALIGLILVVAILRHPIPTLAAALFLAPFSVAILAAFQSRLGAAGPLTYWKDALILALFTRAIVHRVREDRRLPIGNAGDNLLLFYCLAFVAIAILSTQRGTVYPSLGRYVEGPLVLLTIRYLRPTKRQIWILVSAVIGAATIMGATAAFEWLGPRLDFQRWYGASPPPTGEPFVIGSNYRAGSFIYDPLVLAFYLAGAVPFALAVGTIRTRWRSAALLATGLIAAGLIATITRSGYLGGGIGVITVLALAVRSAGIRTALIGITILLSSSAAFYYVTTGSEVFVRSESNEAHRERTVRAFNLAVERPYGYGLGTTDRNIFRAVGRDTGQIGATENSYLSRALEGGVQALALYLITLFVTGVRLRNARRGAMAAGDRVGVALAAGALGALIAVALCGLFLGVLELPVELILWTPAGIALAWASSSPTESPRRPNALSVSPASSSS